MRGWRLAMLAALVGTAMTWSAAARQGASGQTPKAHAESVEALLGAALHQEEVEGNLRAAIVAYEKVLNAPGATRAQAARAYLHIGLCYERLGLAEARKAFETVVRQYADLPDFASKAQTRLASMEAPAVRSGANGGEAVATLLHTAGGGHACSSATRDGKYLLCLGPGAASSDDLMLRIASTGALKRITNAAGCPGPGQPCDTAGSGAIVSPDGLLVAHDYRSEKSGWHIRIWSLDGQLVREFDSSIGNQILDWSPDGKSILVTNRLLSNRASLLVPLSGDGRRDVLAGHKPTAAKYSRSGRYVAFSEEKNGVGTDSDLFVATVGSSEIVSLLSDAARADVIGWAPGDMGIVFASDRDGSSAIWLLPMTEGRPSGVPRLLKGALPGMVMGSQLLDDGTLVYLQFVANLDLHQAEFDAGTGEVIRPPEPLLAQYEDLKTYPEWSPDGASLAFLSRGPSAQGYSSLNVWRPDTGERRTMTPGFRMSSQPVSWSPDGSKLFVLGYGKDSSAAIFTMSSSDFAIAGSSRLDVAGYGTVTADGRVAYALSRPPLTMGAVLRVEVGTPEKHELWRDADGRMLGRLRLSPDHSRLLFSVPRRGDAHAALLSLPLDGGLASTTYEAEPTEHIQAYAWMPDGERVLVVSTVPRSGAETIWKWVVVPQAGGAPKPLKLTSKATSVSVNPDGRRIVFGTSGPYVPPQLWKIEGMFRDAKRTTERQRPRD